MVCGGLLIIMSAITLLACKNLARPRPSFPAEEPGTEGRGVSQVTASARSNLLLSEQQQQQEEEDSASGQPHVIFILIDDVGTNDMGYRSTDLWELTPFLDSLASSGVVLDNYYTNQLCTPSRASLMTGRDSFRTGMQHGIVDYSAPWGLPFEEVTLADRFKAAGYSTHMTGKWHLGVFSDASYPFSRGFDTFLGYTGGGEGYYNHSTCFTPTFEGGEYSCLKDFGYGDEDGYIDYTTNTTKEGPAMVDNYSTTIMTDRAIDVAREHTGTASSDDPLFLYVAYQAAHTPLDAPPPGTFTEEEEETLARVVSDEPDRHVFARIIYYLDKEVRRLHDALEALGVLDNAVIVLASDNGACSSSGGSNHPLRGFKNTTFQGGVRVPAFVYSKSTELIPEEARGTTYSGMMHSTDWTQTLGRVVPGLPLAGMGKELSGFDQWDAIVGRRSAEEGPVRTDMVLGRNSFTFDTDTAEMVKRASPWGAYIHDGWKLILQESCVLWETSKGSYPDPDTVECSPNDECTCISLCDGPVYDFLFHIDADPLETGELPTPKLIYDGDTYHQENLVETMPDKFADMKARFELATKDEVHPAYKPEEPMGFAKWQDFNTWVVAWQ
ncbi:Formylglycine-dependent sulfatase, C-terminal fragment Formylglycine-dependent sulfatase, N-terminal [Ectocarpus siliculosus]|uniref:Formylglycine-dependent sulfatase, C-terminal Formylglycine-dependent sulfatase, N-terminal n=1 Tax=Ectocarpus siliculosus TaxID=2880 RepID=D7G7Y4_ECTSI|nr:Formylglycine-dependent sulfatase, C-terminal fragment Formylglycine-dependent sulfatase, N-terminal [Ectocarpus siliculosus]